MSDATATSRRMTAMVVTVATLGYFVDVYDLIIFSVVRSASLKAIGIGDGDLLPVGLSLLNIQLAGVVVGGVVFGILGDKFGRRSVLFGSIIVYSLANFLNAYVDSLWQYQILRVVAGFGLAGELGAGVTIVSEVLGPRTRGYGTMLIAAIGLLGAVAASEAGTHMDWRSAYLLGAGLGVGLLVLRMGVAESTLFRSLLTTPHGRGDLLALFSSRDRIRRLLLCVLAGLPLYFVIGILITAAPEVGTALGVAPAPTAAQAVLVSYIAMSVGDVACSVLSQIVGSRRKALLTFHGLLAAAIAVFLFVPVSGSTEFYWRCAFLGFGIGYWAVVVTNAAEQFGTNLRATVTTMVPNFIRAMLIPISSVFLPIKGQLGMAPAAAIVGLACVAVAVAATLSLKEPFGRSLDFVEE